MNQKSTSYDRQVRRNKEKYDLDSGYTVIQLTPEQLKAKREELKRKLAEKADNH